LSYASPNLVPGAADALQSVSGHGWDYGWSAGLRWAQGPVSLGASYHSPVKHRLDGTIALSGLVAPLDTANFSAPSSIAFTTPWTASVAARFQATPQLAILAQFDRIGWSRYDAVALAFAGQTVAIPQAYKDVTRFSVGGEYTAGERLTLRAGLGWDPTPTPDTIREAGVPDADQLILSGGFTATLSPGVRLDGALSYADFRRTALSHDLIFYPGTPAQTTGRLQGSVDGHQLTAGAALRVGF
jgi:long-chain fatty acid transport protein